MRIVLRGDTSRLRNPAPFVVSVCVHGGILFWLVLDASLPAAPPRTLYDQEIRPHEKKIVWFNLRDKLPEVAPSVSREDRLPSRARVKSGQTLLAGSRDDAAPGPMIWMPAPEVEAPKPVPLPNVVAVTRPKLVRPFVAPPVAPPRPVSSTMLPDAPRVAAAVEVKPLPLAPVNPPPPPRAFTPPPEVRMQRQAVVQLPEAPATAAVVEPNAFPFASPGPPQRRRFVPPAGDRASGIQPGTQPALAPAPEPAADRADPGRLPMMSKTFAPPLNQPVAKAAAPSLSVEAPVPLAAAPEASLAIVGLNPAKTTEIPAPPGSRRAGFSSGPQPLPEGAASAANAAAMLTVPGLLVRSGAKDSQPALLARLSPTSRESLVAAARIALDSGPKSPAAARAARVSESPDPRMAGRVIYTIAIQMPNITSYSGSWIVWFAEHEPLPGSPPMDLRPPVPLNKVDPKYVAAAISERVEGKVRLAAVIRRDGHVDSIVLLKHLDDRLDQTAREALGKWLFQPAMRDGLAVEVDAVFEIPFHVAPRPAR